VKKPAADASIVGNFLYSSLNTVLNVLIPVVTYPYVARVLGPDNMGRLGIASSFSGYFAVAASFAFPVYAVRAVSSSRGDRRALEDATGELFSLSVVFSAIAAAAYAIAIAAIPRYSSDAALFVVFGAGIVSGPLSIDWLFQGIERFKYIGLRQLVLRSLFVVALFVLVRGQGDAIAYASLFAATGVLSAAVNLATSRRFVRIRPKLKGASRHLKPMLALGIGSFLITAYTNLDFLFLGLMSSDREAGLYNISLRLARVVVTAAATLSAVLLPRLSALAGKDEDEYRRILDGSISAVLLFSLPAGAGLAASAPDFVRVFGGAAFDESARSLQIIAWIVPIVALSNLLQMQVLVPRGKERRMIASFSAALALTAASMVLLVPRCGQIGAAIGMLLGECAVLAGHLVIVGAEERRRLFARSGLLRYGAGALAAGSAALAPRLLLGPGVARLCLDVAAGAAAYLAYLACARDPILRGALRRVLRRDKGRGTR
jgi:O-antigen/teichoic acid export membrane protein